MKKLNRLVIILTAALMSSCSFSGEDNAFSIINKQLEATLSGSIQEVYKCNDYFSIPGVEIESASEVKGSLIFPSGKSRTGNNIKLSEPGVYTLKYTYYLNGRPSYYTQQFTTKYGVYYFSGNEVSNSSARYGEFTEYGEGQDYYVASANTTLHTSNTTRYPNTGLIVELAKNETITFTNPISLDKFTDKEFIQFFAAPYVQKVRDLKALNFYLTDKNDPNVYLRFRVSNRDDVDCYNTTSCITVGGENQILAGLEDNPSNGKYVIHKDDGWGSLVVHSFYSSVNVHRDGYISYTGEQNGVPSSYSQAYLVYDHKSETVYSGPRSDKGLVSFGNQKPTLTAKLRDSDYYETMWNGFSSDEVYLSITGEGYENDKARFVVTGLSVVDDLSAEYLDDVDAPILTVDCPYDPNNMPEGYAGGNYPISKASAIDSLCGSRPVNVTVDYNYTSGNPVSIPVEGDKFHTQKEGVYRIKYSATDGYGNEVSKYYYVHVGRSIPDMRISFANPTDTVDLGDAYHYPVPTIVGGSGEVSYQVILTRNSQETYDITSEGKMYIKQTGNWVVTYVARDYALREKKLSFGLFVYVTNRKFIYDNPTISEFLINNISFKLPEVYYYEYSSGTATSGLCDVAIDYKGTSKTVKAGSSYTPVVTNNADNISFTYKAGTTSIEPISRPVLLLATSNKLNVQNYFFGAESNSSVDSYGVRLVANKEKETISYRYVNSLAINQLSLQIGNIYENYQTLSNFRSIELSFVDSENPDESLTLTMTFTLGNIIFSMDKVSYSVDNSFNRNSQHFFNLYYDYTLNRLIYYPEIENASKSYLSISKFDNGKAFHNFSSGLVNMSMRISDVASGNGIRISKLAGVSLATTVDNIAPTVYPLISLPSKVKQGSDFILSKAATSDLFALSTNTTLTVKNAYGEIVKDSSGVSLSKVDPTKSYSIPMNYFGTYTITYESVESGWYWSNKGTTTFEVKSVDETAPNVRLGEEFPETVSLGSIVYIPSIIVKDNYSSANKITVEVHLFTPSGGQYIIDKNGGFKATELGVYRIYITATDEAGNTGSLTRSVTCVSR